MTATIVPASSTRTAPNDHTSATARTMRAIVQTAYGGPDRMSMAEIERPEIGANEVLVQVRAAGMDRGTWHVMRGEPYLARLALGVRAPKVKVPGLDLAGIVVAVGADVTRFAPGDDVFGIGRGSYAEFAAAREDKLVHKPARLGFEQAAAVPVSGLTALQAVLDAGQLQPGQRVLILGASGGVGSFAAQIARIAGAHVTAVASTAKLDLVRGLGADVVFDYARDDVLAGEPYDLIVDIGGNRSLGSLRAALTKNGTLVIVGAEGGGKALGIGRQLRAVALSPFVTQRLAMLVSSENHTDLERLARLIERGDVVPMIDRTYPLAEVPAAMRHLESGTVRGKLVICIP